LAASRKVERTRQTMYLLRQIPEYETKKEVMLSSSKKGWWRNRNKFLVKTQGSAANKNQEQDLVNTTKEEEKQEHQPKLYHPPLFVEDGATWQAQATWSQNLFTRIISLNL